MPEIKVECDCGQRYKFEVEPVNGRMPYPVNCPSCGLDGTEKANAVLRQSAPTATAPAPAMRVGLGAAPAASQAPAPPIAPPGPPKLRIGTPSHAAPAPAIAAAPAPAPRRFVPAPAPALKAKSNDGQPKVLLGVIGAVIGGFIGMMAWFWLIKATGYAIGYAAWGVGVLTGISARLLSRGGSLPVGAAAALCATLAILGGQYLFAADLVKSSPLGGLMEGSKETAQSAAAAEFDDMAKHGEEAVKAQTDDEIKALYKKIYDETPDADELTEFKENQLPELRDIGSGKVTKEQFLSKLKSESDALDFKLRWILFKATLDGMTLLFLLLGVSSAFKIGMGS